MSEAEPSLGRVLIVDDDAPLLNALRRGVESSGREVVAASCLAEALACLRDEEALDLVITDVRLGPDSGVTIARAAAARLPAPPVIAITGLASAKEALELGKAGVRALLQKPFAIEELVQAIEQLDSPEELELGAVVRRTVGARPLRGVLDEVRRSMVLEALARTGNNKTEAAALLGISRQNLQLILARGQA